jgi:hypothetical protein
MAELSLFWDGSTVGDHGPYADNDLMDTYFRAILNGTGNEGVLNNWLNQLVYSFPAANTVRVATGGAIVYGLWYENDANVDVNIPNGPRTDLIVVRRDWAAQTARITRIPGPGAVVTQVAGATWDIPLYTVDVDGVGAVVLNTDLRDYCEFSTDPRYFVVQEGTMPAGAVTWPKLVNETHWITRGAGQLIPDGTNPATWVANTAPAGLPPSYYTIYGHSYGYGWPLHRDMWEFSDGASDAVWFTFRVPEDLVGAGANMTLYIWTSWTGPYTAGNTDERWVYNLYGGVSGAALVNQTAATVFAENHCLEVIWRVCRKHSLGTFTATAGDIIHCQIIRTGADALDTSLATAYLFMVQVSYMSEG